MKPVSWIAALSVCGVVMGVALVVAGCHHDTQTVVVDQEPGPVVVYRAPPPPPAVYAGPPPQPPVVAGQAPPPPPVVVVQQAPPPVVVEQVPPPPPGPYVWIDGHYIYQGGAFVWVPGCYALAPEPGCIWVSDCWIRGRFGWEYHRGFWNHGGHDHDGHGGHDDHGHHH